jgi:CheY-like chemotaxis protein
MYLVWPAYPGCWIFCTVEGMDSSVTFGTANILVVDDDLEVREILAETLVELGYGVVQAASGEEALPILRERSDIDLLISDVRMPGMSGLELAEQAQARVPGLKVILISGYFLPQPIAVRFLKKPFHMHELASAVRAELDGAARA